MDEQSTQRIFSASGDLAAFSTVVYPELFSTYVREKGMDLALTTASALGVSLDSRIQGR